MLPRPLRVRLSTEFATVTRTGRKARCGSVVVYRTETLGHATDAPVSRGGVIVGRAVGDAVTRHRVSRLIRAELADLLPQGRGELIVVRALPGAGVAAAPVFRRDVRVGLAKLRSRHADGATQTQKDMGPEPGTGPAVSR